MQRFWKSAKVGTDQYFPTLPHSGGKIFKNREMETRQKSETFIQQLANFFGTVTKFLNFDKLKNDKISSYLTQ